MSGQDRLTLGDAVATVLTVELAVLSEVVDLVESEVVGVQVARREGAAVLKDFVKALLDRRELVGLQGKGAA